MSFASFFFTLLVLASIATSKSTPRQMGEITVERSPLPKVNSDTACEACWDIADQALEVWTEIFLYSGTFASCVDFCYYDTTYGEMCAAVCTVLGDELFFELLNYTDLDPVYVCQLLTACPIDDCVGNCAAITNLTATPNTIVIPPQGVQTYFSVAVSFNITKKWTGTGVVYFQVQQCMQQNCVFQGNNFGLLLPNGYIGPMTYTFTYQYNCPVQFSVGLPLQCEVFVCNGNCDEYGVARHPHSALYASGSVIVTTQGNGCDGA